MLEIDSLDVFHGRLQVLWDLSLRVERGEIVTVIGPNGAGKTTLVETVMGLNRPVRGSIRFEGEEIGGLSPNAVVSRGISIVAEKRELFPRMTVRENLMLGAYVREQPPDLSALFDLFPVLAERQDQLAGTMSGGEQQMLAIARALAAGPRLLILDEPSLGLSPLFVSNVLESIAALNRDGLTILLLEQNVLSALEVSDRAYVLENGRVAMEGPSEALLHDPRVQASYLGV
ncbi:MAG TPA: ABC transporter ATP-binding protein [Methanoregulaceae archaeon]|nr:ABC transporter ATP-binding protein [Methanoregulaceae archaeon]HOV66771.1 ABC transporter ATP-binding protein [Methanoregulaceae archaeon]HQJ87955.1 ABC transporter ATP-binding protein [Methanoregulaceae archaeon]